jgi:hypothetical protein
MTKISISKFIVFGIQAQDGYLANVKINLSRSASDVSEISISHLSWPVDNATHDSDLPGKYVYR